MGEEQKKEVLKGNFTTRKPVLADDMERDLTDEFELEALKRLGGSIAFVSKKKLLFGMDEGKSPKESDKA